MIDGKGTGRVARRSRQDWAQLVKEAGKSGHSLAEFGRRRGVSSRQLTWWKWHLGRTDGNSTGRRSERRRPGQRVGQVVGPVKFIEARVVGQASETLAANASVQRPASTAEGMKASFELELGSGRLSWSFSWRR